MRYMICRWLRKFMYLCMCIVTVRVSYQDGHNGPGTSQTGLTQGGPTHLDLWLRATMRKACEGAKEDLNYVTTLCNLMNSLYRMYL